MKNAIAPGSLIFSFILFIQPVQAMTVGDLLISEIMADPASISDARGEWFELYNPTAEQINLRGIDLGDDGGSRHRFDSDLLILPGEYLTLARSDAPGFVPDYVYDNFTLSNGGDQIVFRDGLVELLRLDYGSGFAVAGRSRELSKLPAIADNYLLALTVLDYGAGDFGTPGSGEGLPAVPAAVPLPAAIWLFASALLTLLLPRRQALRFPVLRLPKGRVRNQRSLDDVAGWSKLVRPVAGEGTGA